MPTIKRFEDIRAWQTARELTRLVYKLSGQGKFSRDFGLRDQIRRAAVSVMSNIAEGYESRTQGHFINYLGHAKASAGEVRSQLYVALDCGYVTEDQFREASDLADKVSRQIYRFSAYLEKQRRGRQIRESRARYEVFTFERLHV